MIDRIETLLEEGDEPTLEHIESTLTDGYAEALRLEGDRIKIERRIDQVVVAPTATEAKAEELNSLILRLSRTREDLDQLRDLLGNLKLRARAARTAAAAQA